MARTTRPLRNSRGRCGDTLARYIVVELAETFDADAPDDAQLAEAARVVSNARMHLDNVRAALGHA